MIEPMQPTREYQRYIAERLEDGGSLSHLALGAFSFEDGRVRLIAGSATNYSNQNLNYGGVALRKESLRELAKLIQRDLGELGCSIIIEDTLAKPDDPVIKQKEANIALHKEGVYYYLTRGEYQLE